MTLEIKERGSEAFYTEAVNVMTQFKDIIRDHDHKLKDNLGQFKWLMIASGGLFAALVAMTAFWGAGTLSIIGLIISGISTVLCALYLININRYKKTMMADTRTAVLTMDENGVELSKDGAPAVRISWDKVELVKRYDESLNFIASEQAATVISIYRQYEDEIQSWLDQNRPEIEIA